MRRGDVCYIMLITFDLLDGSLFPCCAATGLTQFHRSPLSAVFGPCWYAVNLSHWLGTAEELVAVVFLYKEVYASSTSVKIPEFEC